MDERSKDHPLIERLGGSVVLYQWLRGLLLCGEQCLPKLFQLFRGNLGPSMEDSPEHTLVAGRSGERAIVTEVLCQQQREQPSHVEGRHGGLLIFILDFMQVTQNVFISWILSLTHLNEDAQDSQALRPLSSLTQAFVGLRIVMYNVELCSCGFAVDQVL